MRSGIQPHRAFIAYLLTTVLLAGCQSTREQLLAEGYPEDFADGFEAGCSSGRQAAGALNKFRKDVPRYSKQQLYAEGWNDGFRQCQATAEHSADGGTRDRSWRDRDREWQHHVDQAKGQAMRRK
ncbi:hypothetical protein GFL09_06570 [Pseudomonas stutzeri]|uniref:hypothetical protein n=1 Tax=Stutzerimonas TaxID=2901164 RepID=UPI000E996821|nr:MULTISPECIES: hypothetical protein [Stutzerimonas]MBK3867362.1 hypothetical protein [Stutzerimonas stutzeri]HBB79235.1 hypothetical protein [Pseudomonas sp.]HBC00605.1 hypothetical protein [Pseudomonas sp.]HCL75947.1 hypothetical protein [Pseudomonas sp.]